MGNGASKDYKFGQKNNWRRTLWNEVLRRTAGREKDEYILYLAGPQDLDRVIAIDKGVPDENLVAIDRDDENVNRIRAGKHPAIHGDIEDVIASWPVSRSVCAVILDFCAGFTQPAVDIYDLLERKPFRRAVVAINMQRGRDSYSNKIREHLSGSGFDLLNGIASWGYGGMSPGVTEKHRALQWLVYHALDAAEVGIRGYLDQIVKAPGYEPGFEDALGIVYAGNYFKNADPRFYSYKSGVLTFDSLVCSNPLRLTESFAESEGLLPEMDKATEQHHASQRSQEMARKITAMLAVRTTRLAS